MSKLKIVGIREIAPNESIKNGPGDWLLEFIKNRYQEMKAIPDKPRPGPHCENWFGVEECQFLGNGCPLGDTMPAVVDEAVQVEAVEEGRPGFTASAILKHIADNPDFALTQELAEWALAGNMQLKALTKRIDKAVEAFSRKHGPLTIGKDKYAWHTTTDRSVDKVFALTELLRAMTIPEIAKLISLSYTAIKGIRKTEYPQLREMLLDLAIDEVEGKPKFGPIKNEITEETNE